MTIRRAIQIINVPLDLGASLRGTDAGPSGFRIAGLHAAMEQLGCEVHAEVNIPAPVMDFYQQLDTRARYKHEILAVCKQLAECVHHAAQAGSVPLVIGGDHSIAMGSVSGIAHHFHQQQQQQQKLGVIWFDAHADMNTPESSPSGNVHGMSLAHLLGYGDKDLSSIMGTNPAVLPENVVLVGIRDIDKDERAFVNACGVTTFTMRDIDVLGMVEVSRLAREAANRGTAGFHLSFDLDVLDPEVIPGTGTKVPGGVSYREAHLLMEDCAIDGRMVSMDVVELNPFLDKQNISAERAVRLVKSAFGNRIL